MGERHGHLPRRMDSYQVSQVLAPMGRLDLRASAPLLALRTVSFCTENVCRTQLPGSYERTDDVVLPTAAGAAPTPLARLELLFGIEGQFDHPLEQLLR
jgi:hypothetical protein